MSGLRRALSSLRHQRAIVREALEQAMLDKLAAGPEDEGRAERDQIIAALRADLDSHKLREVEGMSRDLDPRQSPTQGVVPVPAWRGHGG